jgi:hypothetical protein
MPAKSMKRNIDAELQGLAAVSYVSIGIAIIAVTVAVFAIFFSTLSSAHTSVVYVQGNTTNTSTQAQLRQYNISGQLITPPHSLSSDPVITANQSFGSRLTGINSPLNQSELSVFNNAPDSYFETAGEMYLNHTLNNSVGASVSKVPPFMLNGKPSVIYFGSITCVFCGENRWAMALALSRFGNFTTLYKGYSSFGDYDLPTLYWSPAHYNQSAIDLGSFYQSNYINFIAIEDTSPITRGFNLQTFSTMQSEVNATGNVPFEDAFSFALSTITNPSQFGTPYTIWGSDTVLGADAQDFGNSTPRTSTIPLTYMTHGDVISQLHSFNDQFSWSEYAAADLYIAMTCSSLNNTAPICHLPAIQAIEKANGY